MIVAICIAGAAVGWALFQIITAPLGYEDGTGFHLGTPDHLPRHNGKSVRGEDQFHSGGNA